MIGYVASALVAVSLMMSSEPGTREHAAYLRRMGFAPGAAANDRYRLSV